MNIPNNVQRGLKKQIFGTVLTVMGLLNGFINDASSSSFILIVLGILVFLYGIVQKRWCYSHRNMAETSVKPL